MTGGHTGGWYEEPLGTRDEPPDLYDRLLRPSSDWALPAAGRSAAEDSEQTLATTPITRQRTGHWREERLGTRE